MRGTPWFAGWLLVAMAAGAHAQLLAVVDTTPDANAIAAPDASIVVDFDRALAAGSVDASSVRVFGRSSGTSAGKLALSNGGTRLRFTPDAPWSAGETVYVDLSHDLRAADASPLRGAGYAFQFGVAVVPSQGLWNEVGVLDNGAGTRLYGANASDFDNDGYLDLATVNETSADVRVYLNRADGSGTFHASLAPVSIGSNGSPNASADFDNDGNTDLCISSRDTDSVWVLLGRGDGSFRSVQEISVGDRPRGVALLDVDGDGDWDIAVANQGSNDLALLENDGNGVFGPASFIEAGVDAEYGLAAGDMDLDGIRDLVVGGRDSESVNVLLGNGDGSFTPAASSRDTGGRTWVVALADANGDGILDVSTANSSSDNASVLFGSGDGTLGPPQVVATGSLTVSTDFGDLDGDGFPEWVISSFGGGWWRIYANDGNGGFSFDREFEAPENASCAVLYDADNDGDLDMALTDEIADVLLLQENANPAPCSPAPLACRVSVEPGRSRLDIRNDAGGAKDKLGFKWDRGEVVSMADFGDPENGDDYSLCIYDAGALIHGAYVPAGGTCAGRPCWRSSAKGARYRDADQTPDGIDRMQFKAGLAGKSKASIRGRGARLGLADFASVTGPLDVQIQRADGQICLGARFSAPFRSHDERTLKARAD